MRTETVVNIVVCGCSCWVLKVIDDVVIFQLMMLVGDIVTFAAVTKDVVLKTSC